MLNSGNKKIKIGYIFHSLCMTCVLYTMYLYLALPSRQNPTDTCEVSSKRTCGP